jgi:Pla-1/cef family extracellular lipase
MGGDAGCEAVPRGAACQVVGELTFGVDFVPQKSGDSLAIIPLKPLKAKTGYLLVLNDTLSDTNSESIAPSVTYDFASANIDKYPLGAEGSADRGLQGVINSYENAVVAYGADQESIIYTAAMTTQSVQDTSQAIKLLMLSGTTGTTPIVSPITPTGANAAMLLGLDGDDFGAGTQASYASVSKSTLSSPYYLDTPYYDGSDGSCNLLSENLFQTCSDLFSNWEAMGDSPVTVLGALQSGTLSQESFATQAIAQGKDPAELIANPSQLVGLTFTVDVIVDGATISVPVDSERNLTKYNPLPKIKSYKTGASAIDVIITTPDVNRINQIATMKKGSALTVEETMVMPTGGWPVMIYSHGITGTKESVLAISGALASQGVATISIDHPYHGARGIDFNADGVYEISATSPNPNNPSDPYANGDVQIYMNLQSLLTARDNVRQSEVDLLALRLSLNDPSLYGVLDATQVSFLGHSLGGITGTAFVALANSGLIDPATGEPMAVQNPYAVNSASLAMPGGGISGLLLNSPAFGPVVMGALTSSSTFQDLVEAESGMKVEDMTDEQYQGYVAAIYPGFAVEFNFAAQAVIDSSDPINYASTVKATMTPIHVIEVVGDEEAESVNKPDQVIPNEVASLPLAGSEPLIRALGLGDLGASSSVGDGTEKVSAVVRFINGHHSSVLDPNPQDGVAEDNTLEVTVEMQTQVVGFAASKGMYLPITENTADLTIIKE